jgi:uncharacterized membrane protein HdeD (DUF308 family)
MMLGAAMTSWKRWQDYATMFCGVLIGISPFVFGETNHNISSIGAYVLGILLIAGGVVAAMTKEPRRSLVVNAPGIAAILTFVGGVVLLFRSAPGIAWTMIVLSVVSVLIGATLRLGAPKTD